jgi:hypothetical protein
MLSMACFGASGVFFEPATLEAAMSARAAIALGRIERNVVLISVDLVQRPYQSVYLTSQGPTTLAWGASAGR